jgi:hypothetical protein
MVVMASGGEKFFCRSRFNLRSMATMKRAYIILVAMMVAVLGGAGESDSVAVDIEQLVLAGNKYLKGPGANASTAKKEDFRKEILDGLKDKKVSFAATVKDVVRHNGLGGIFLMTLTDTSQKAIVYALASTSDKKAIDLKVGERVSITGLISRIHFASSPVRDGRLSIDVVTIESELTVIGVEPAPVAKASPVTDPTPVVKTTPFTKPVSVASVCGKCRGAKKCTWPECRGGHIYQKNRKITACRECNGTGKCLRCGGTGWE